MLTTVHIIGILLTVSVLLAVSILSGRKVKDARSFTTGGRAGSWMVCGAILGTLVGGQSTIGTAQLAFSFGLSAWWFTIGAALGALVLGLVYAAPLRRSGCSTLMEVVRQQYGRRAETVGSILFLVGIFIRMCQRQEVNMPRKEGINSLSPFPISLLCFMPQVVVTLYKYVFSAHDPGNSLSFPSQYTQY